MKVNDENSRNRIHKSEAWIRGSRSRSGSTPKYRGSATLTTVVPEVRHLRLHLPLAFPLLDLLALDVHEALLLAQAHEQAPEFGLYFAEKEVIAVKTLKDVFLMYSEMY